MHGVFALTEAQASMVFPEHEQLCRHMYHGLHRASKNEIILYHAEEEDSFAYVLSTFVLRCSTYLPWLRERFTQHGGITVQKKVASLSELSSYDVVINCTGVGAGVLAGDPNVYPAKVSLYASRHLGSTTCIQLPFENQNQK